MKLTTMRTVLMALFLIIGISSVTSDFVVNDASAQSRRESRELQEQLDTIVRQLRAVQDRLIQHLDEANANGGSEDAAGGNEILADMEVRLSVIQRELRNITGQFEEVRYAQRQMEARIDRLQADMEMRLQDLEQGGVTYRAEATEGGDAGSSPNTAASDDGISTTLVPVTTPEEARALVDEWERQQVEAGNDIDGMNAPQSVAQVSVLPASQDVLPEGTAEERYEAAFGYMRRGDYETAEKAFMEFLTAHPDSDLAGNAQYWLGESYYARRDYANAAAAFLAGYQNYQDGSKGPDSVLKLGMSLSQMDQREDACAVFDELMARYSDANQTILRSAEREIQRNNCS